jgi:hypothetical protein
MRSTAICNGRSYLFMSLPWYPCPCRGAGQLPSVPSRLSGALYCCVKAVLAGPDHTHRGRRAKGPQDAAGGPWLTLSGDYKNNVAFYSSWQWYLIRNQRCLQFEPRDLGPLHARAETHLPP